MLPVPATCPSAGDVVADRIWARSDESDVFAPAMAADPLPLPLSLRPSAAPLLPAALLAMDPLAPNWPVLEADPDEAADGSRERFGTPALRADASPEPGSSLGEKAGRVAARRMASREPRELVAPVLLPLRRGRPGRSLGPEPPELALPARLSERPLGLPVRGVSACRLPAAPVSRWLDPETEEPAEGEPIWLMRKRTRRR